MLKILLVSFLFSFVTFGSVGGANSDFDINTVASTQDSIFQTSDWDCNSSQGEFISTITFEESVGTIPSIEEYTYNQRGCCSWHDGVCGCENGRKLCCDGTLSPTCTC